MTQFSNLSGDADPSTPVDSRLHAEAERLRVSRDKYEQYRLDLTQQCLGVDDYPIIGPDGKEVEFQPGFAQGQNHQMA